MGMSTNIDTNSLSNNIELKIIKDDTLMNDTNNTKESIFESLQAKQTTSNNLNNKESNIGLDLLVNQTKKKNENNSNYSKLSSKELSNHNDINYIKSTNSNYALDEMAEMDVNKTDELYHNTNIDDDNISVRSFSSRRSSNKIKHTFDLNPKGVPEQT